MDASGRQRAIGASGLGEEHDQKSKPSIRQGQNAKTRGPYRLPLVGYEQLQNSSQKGVPAAGRFAPALQAHPSMRKCSPYCSLIILFKRIRLLLISSVASIT